MASSESEKILNTVLDLGAALIRCGADTHKTEKHLYRICAGYGFKDSNIWVIPSNIQASTTDQEGNTYTMIRHVRSGSTDYSRLAELNDFARKLSKTPMGSEELRRVYDRIMNSRPQPLWIFCLAGILGGLGFGIFFNCDVMDALVTGIVSLIVALLGRRLSRFEKNPLIYNFILSFVSEMLILLCVRAGFGHHTGYITIGVVMLLISGIGATNGFKDLMHLDTMSGVLKLTESLLGAAGIAVGIGLPLFIFRSWGITSPGEMMMVNPSHALSLISGTIGCIGFGLWFNVKWKHVPFCGIGAFITWGVYRLISSLTGGSFLPVLGASAVCAGYAQLIARITRAPSTIFMRVSVYPLVPGAALYYMMNGIVFAETDLAFEKCISLFSTCFAIVLGIMIVEVIVRCIRKAGGKLPTIE